MTSDLRSKILRLASPDVMFFTLAWLMVIVILGTVAQKYIGLYQAQRIFFSSWLMWLGPVPLPGGLLALAVIFSCLCIKLVFASAWNTQNAGIIVTHMGGLLLLVGGLLTSFASTDGSMVIYEGGSANYISDYHARELAVYDVAQNKKIAAIALEKLTPGASFAVPGLPLVIDIITSCRNCDVVKGQNFALKTLPLEKEDEQNKSGVEFRVSGTLYFSVDYSDDAPVVKSGGKSYRIALEKRRTYLPFSISLRKFEKETHPGTDIARSYRSLVTLHDGATEWPSLIQMNEPLRYKGYTFYQSSFFAEDGKQATVLAVVKNAGRMFPYISGIVICIGLILHMMLRLPKLVTGIVRGRVNKIVALMFLLALPHHAHAADAFDYSAFKEIPVLDQGRVKPLSTVAQNYLKEFYGASSLPDMTPSQWFAELIFTPEAAYNRDIFNISDPRVVDALSLPRRSPHAYSYHEVGMALLQNPKAWQGLFAQIESQLTPSQKELMNVYSETKLYGQLARSLSLFFPDFKIPAGPIATALGVPPEAHLTYDEMLRHEAALDNLAKTAMQRSHEYPQLPPLLRASDARAILDLEKQLDTIGDDRENDAFKVIPPQWEGEKTGKLWYSPWGITFQGQGAPDVVKFLALWKTLVIDYRQDDAGAFLATSKAIDAESLRMASDGASADSLRLEVAYNDYQPFKISMGFYALAFMLVLASLAFRGDNKLYYASAVSLLLGFTFHGIGLLSRMIIMGRPPVTNLYASIIFVGFVVALVGMAYEWRMRNRIGVIIAAIAGLLLQYLGLSYDAEGETMGMLIAVLDTNFWLSTHVVCMTTGYACCILGSLMAHVYLVLRIARPNAPQLEELSRNIRGIGYLALTFSTVGTILGGIWADQSWGRFWGWDPKENGALLICLWLLFLAHGRMAGRLKELGYNIGMALTAVIVSLAWFGVNLLAVGLHSYGFTEGAATGLFTFIGGEIVFTLVSYVVITKWRKAFS